MISRHDADDILHALLAYLRDRGLISTWLKNKVRLVRSKKANEQNHAAARQFCFIIIGEHEIHYADALLKLPMNFLVGILLHEITHMVVKEGRDPELDVDEWVFEKVPEAGYDYRDCRYGKRVAKNLECVSETFIAELMLND